MRPSQLFRCFHYMRLTPFACLAIAALPLAGCSEPVGCDICTTSAVVYGTVRRSSGDPVQGAPVLIGAFQESCSGEAVVPGDPGLTTGADGRYRVHLVAPTGEFSACVRVEAMEPGSSSGDPGVIAEGTVDFLPDFGDDLQRDSVQVDVELPAPGAPQ